MHRLILNAALLLGAVLPLAAWTAPASPFQLAAPTVSRIGDQIVLRGRVCRSGLTRAGAPIVELSNADPVRAASAPLSLQLDGDLRGRAGGCAVYRTTLARSAPPAQICVRSALIAESRHCRDLQLPPRD